MNEIIEDARYTYLEGQAYMPKNYVFLPEEEVLESNTARSLFWGLRTLNFWDYVDWIPLTSFFATK